MLNIKLAIDNTLVQRASNNNNNNITIYSGVMAAYQSLADILREVYRLLCLDSLLQTED
jgi:hypothetical protein